ncbi:Serine/threonine-protein kinase SBK2 [Oryzias melastigma]|uniref:Serine/threonine-protein kinase SBK2 n=1 Tax=Oryzias melastigma TaxID=30732 RepID=A0A834BZY0_ORYME|nr:Serine/threonine-protein kinase SBK2 [Oryzias melastigma]
MTTMETFNYSSSPHFKHWSLLSSFKNLEPFPLEEHRPTPGPPEPTRRTTNLGKQRNQQPDRRTTLCTSWTLKANSPPMDPGLPSPILDVWDRKYDMTPCLRAMIELGLADGSLIDELMELTAQSINHLEIQERFNVIKEIGRGKYGKVLLVTHRCRGTPMALKVMPKASTKLQGFLREYCISLHLSCHPCIVGLFGIAFQSKEHYCFAQELVIGRDLWVFRNPR